MCAKIVNHYGKWINSDIPTTGVLSINQINSQVLYDEMFGGDSINLDWEERLQNFKDNPFSSDYEIDIAELSELSQEEIYYLMRDSLVDITLDMLSEEAQEELLDAYYQSIDGYDSSADTYLIGDWIKDKQGYYIPDKDGEYSAIVNETTIQVVYSKYTIRVSNLCSPCYPGQADICTDDNNQPINNDDGYLAYNLPSEFFN